jgi:peptidoglycan/xylan/chitin deacetylase (PgdA/CDA1 family)
LDASITGWLLRLLSPAGKRARAQIFSYHRVQDAENRFVSDDPTIDDFRMQMSCISEVCNVLPLSELVYRFGEGSLPANAAAITFDDGYINNLTHALPVLEEYQLPATIFVAVEPVKQGIMWNDLIIEALSRTQGKAHFQYKGLAFNFEANRSCIEDVLGKFKYLLHEERAEAAHQFYSFCTDVAPPRLMLTPEMIAECKSSLIEFGAHSISHPILANLDDERCRHEIYKSRQIISDWCGAEIQTFAYPNGRPGKDFGPREMNLVKEAGYIGAVSTLWGPLTRESDVFAIPRYTPWEHSPGGFKRRILLTNANL